MTTPSKEGFLAAIGGLLAEVDRECLEAYQELSRTGTVTNAVASVKKLDFESFYFEMLYPFDQAVDGLLSAELPDAEKAHFVFRHYRFIDNHLCRLFWDYEGSAFSADKARTVLRSIVGFVLTRKPITFDYSDGGAYYLPARVLKKHDEIVALYEALQCLYHGNPRPYLRELTRLHQQATSAG
jgi:hypothetical protein